MTNSNIHRRQKPLWAIHQPWRTIKSWSNLHNTETGDQRGGEWEPIKISLEINPSAYFPKITINPQSKVWENSYGLAISQQHTLENFAEAKEPTRCESQNTSEGTGQTGRAGADVPDRSDRFHRPVRPIAPRQPATKAPNGKSRANEVQIQRNLEDSFASTPWTYPQKIFLKRLTDRENLEEDQIGLGFSQELTKSNSGEVVIPEGLALG